MQYKHWGADEMWLPHAGDEPLQPFKLDSHGQEVLPVGLPLKVLPEWAKKNDLDGVKQYITKFHPFMTKEQQQWWDRWLTDENNRGGPYEDWLPSFLQDTNTYSEPHILPSTEEEELQSPLFAVMAAERSAPPVSVK